MPSSCSQTAHPPQVERQTHELELGLDFVQSPKAELPEPQHALDPSIGRLHDPLPLAVSGPSLGRPQLGIHGRGVRVLFGVDTHRLLALAPQRHDQLARAVLELLEHRLRAKPRIGQHLLRVLAQVGLHRRQQHRQAVAVGSGVAQFGRHHDLRGLVHRRVRVVAVVVATTGALHDPAVRVGEALLGVVLGYAEVARVAPTLGFAVFAPRLTLVVLAAPTRGIGFLLALLQAQLGCRDCGQPVLSPLDLCMFDYVQARPAVREESDRTRERSQTVSTLRLHLQRRQHGHLSGGAVDEQCGHRPYLSKRFALSDVHRQSGGLQCLRAQRSMRPRPDETQRRKGPTSHPL